MRNMQGSIIGNCSGIQGPHAVSVVAGFGWGSALRRLALIREGQHPYGNEPAPER